MTTHGVERLQGRDAPYEMLRVFDPESWELMTADVRVDTGKFVRTAWRVRCEGRDWWVAIGYRDVIQTVYAADVRKVGMSEQIVKSGELYDYVERVNRELMTRDALAARGGTESS